MFYTTANANICDDCGSHKLVIQWREGDIVCSQCGLVKEERILDDTYYGNKPYDEDIQPALCSNEAQNETIKWAIESLLGDGNTILIDLCTQMFHAIGRTSGKSLRGKTRRAVIAAAIYCASKYHKRGLTAEAIYSMFEIDMWFMYSDICVLWSTCPEFKAVFATTTIDDALARMVYSNLDIPFDATKQVLKYCNILRDAVGSHLTNAKVSKLNACFVYIACQQSNLDISKKDIHKAYGVSMATLTKHETMIQDILEHIGPHTSTQSL
jgi:transcription initiation factor TFIIIB Brf1 subunit/transcription initiation factor TFIIB